METRLTLFLVATAVQILFFASRASGSGKYRMVIVSGYVGRLLWLIFNKCGIVMYLSSQAMSDLIYMILVANINVYF